MNNKLTYCCLIGLALLTSCSNNQTQQDSSYVVGGIVAFVEMVNAGVKKMALSAPVPSSEMDNLMAEATRVAEQNNVSLLREPDLIVTDLFPAEDKLYCN